MWEEQQREICGRMHKQCRVLDNRSEEAESKHWWLPNQHQIAEGFLALGLRDFTTSIMQVNEIVIISVVY